MVDKHELLFNPHSYSRDFDSVAAFCQNQYSTTQLFEDLESQDYDLKGKFNCVNYLYRNEIMLTSEDYVKAIKLLINIVLPSQRPENPT